MLHRKQNVQCKVKTNERAGVNFSHRNISFALALLLSYGIPS